MLNPELQGMVDHAVKLVTSGYTPRDAVVQAVRGAGLSREGVQRICEGTNKSLLERDKASAYKSSQGRIWTNRWTTAKPDEVCLDLGIGVDPASATSIVDDAATQISKTSSPRPPSLSQALSKISSPQILPDAPETPKTSATEGVRPIDYDPVERIVDMLTRAKGAKDHAEKRVQSAAIGVATCEEVLVQRALDIEKKTDMTPGEVLWAIKNSGIDDGAYRQAFGRLCGEWGVDLDAVSGIKYTEEGRLDALAIKTSQAKLAVRGAFSSDPVAGGVRIDPQHPLTRAAREFGEAFEDLEVTKIALSSLQERVKQWSRQAAEVAAG